MKYQIKAHYLPDTVELLLPLGIMGYVAALGTVLKLVHVITKSPHLTSVLVARSKTFQKARERLPGRPKPQE